MKTVNYADLTSLDRQGIKFWGDFQAEELHHEDLDEAIESYLDGAGDGYFGDINEATAIEFGGFVPMKIDDSSAAEWVLELLLERWDEDYANAITGEGTQQTDVMKAAAAEFIEKVRAEYHVWSCEPVIKVVVPVLAWVKQHAPEWLEDPVALAGGKELAEDGH